MSSASLTSVFARERLRRALDAAGLSSPSELVELAVTAGQVRADEAGQIVHRMSMEDLGAELGAQLAEHTGSGEDAEQRRKAFFAGLLPLQQDALLLHLSESEHKSLAQLAVAFKVPLPRLRQALNEAILKKGEWVQSVSMEHVVGAMVMAAERSMRELAQEGSWAAYWKVQKELAGKLEDLGIVRRTPKRLDVTVHGIDDLQKQELERLLELERKQERRSEEIKRAQVSLIDALPAHNSRDAGPAPRPALQGGDPNGAG